MPPIIFSGPSPRQNPEPSPNPSRKPRMKNRPGRAITREDKFRILDLAKLEASTGNFVALRLRALILLTLGSGLRLSESTALVGEQLLDSQPPKLRIRSNATLYSHQAKRARARRFVIPTKARAGLLAYIRAGIKLRKIAVPIDTTARIFVSFKGTTGAGINIRAIQNEWHGLQRRAGISPPYRWHDLRHEAASSFAKHARNPWQVRDFLGVKNLNTATIYIHTEQDLLEIAEKAE